MADAESRSSVSSDAFELTLFVHFYQASRAPLVVHHGKSALAARGV